MAALLQAGWQRQIRIDEPRLSELAETYRGLGLEVKVVYEPSDVDGCSSCFDAVVSASGMDRRVGTLFTRPGMPSAGDDELF